MVRHPRVVNRYDYRMCFGIPLEMEKTRTIYSVCTVLFDKWIFVFDYNSIFVIIVKIEGMKQNILKSFAFAFFCGFFAFNAPAAVSLFSDYGQIQNVQKYSSNPFWNPNSPYNQRTIPQPVYVQGTDLNTEDCINVVQSLVSVQCMVRDNCKDTTLADIRPEIMIQLSRLPGNNYVSACAGYLDGVFDSYVKQFSDSVPNHPVAFPEPTVPNPMMIDDTNSEPDDNY